jgi:hypothetical protein
MDEPLAKLFALTANRLAKFVSKTGVFSSADFFHLRYASAAHRRFALHPRNRSLSFQIRQSKAESFGLGLPNIESYLTGYSMFGVRWKLDLSAGNWILKLNPRRSDLRPCQSFLTACAGEIGLVQF